MLSEKERNKRFDDILAIEEGVNIPKYLWLSFCDPDKPKGSQFLGVIITSALGLSHAIEKTHTLGINPGGEILSFEVDENDIRPEHFDKLLTGDEIIKYGYGNKMEQKK